MRKSYSLVTILGLTTTHILDKSTSKTKLYFLQC